MQLKNADGTSSSLVYNYNLENNLIPTVVFVDHIQQFVCDKSIRQLSEMNLLTGVSMISNKVSNTDTEVSSRPTSSPSCGPAASTSTKPVKRGGGGYF